MNRDNPMTESEKQHIRNILNNAPLVNNINDTLEQLCQYILTCMNSDIHGADDSTFDYLPCQAELFNAIVQYRSTLYEYGCNENETHELLIDWIECADNAYDEDNHIDVMTVHTFDDLCKLIHSRIIG